MYLRPQARYLIVLGQQWLGHTELSNTTPDRGPRMHSRAELGGHGMRAWAAGPAAPAPSPAQLQHDGCARRRGEPRVEQLPGNRLLSRPTLRPLSPSQGPFFFPSSSLFTGARPCGTGEKLQPVPTSSPCHQESWEPMAPGRKREKVMGEKEESGRPSLAVKNSAGTLLSLALSPPPITTHSQTPQAALKNPEHSLSPTGGWCLEGWSPRIYSGPGLPELGTGAAP